MSIARHTTYNLAGALVPLAVLLVTVPLYLKVIGLDRYGILSICWVLVSYFGLFELGLGPATSQMIAMLDSKSPSERSETVWAALIFSSALGILGGLLLFLVAGFVLDEVRVGQEGLRLEIRESLPWLALLVPMSTSYGVLYGALQGRQRFLALNLVSAAGNVLVGAIPLLIALAHGPELPNLIAAIAGTRLLTVAMLAIFCLRSVPILRPVVPSGPILKSLAQFGGWVTGAAILTPLLTSSEKFVIGWLVGAAAVSLYVVPFNLVARLLVLPQSLASALFPKFAMIEGSEVDELERRSLASLCSVSTVLTVVGLAVMTPFLQVWIGPRLGGQSAPLGTIILVGMWFNACSFVPHARLQGRGRPDLITKISLAQLVPYLLIMALSIQLFGVAGAAIAWSARAAVEMLVFFVVTGQVRELLAIVWRPAILVIISAGIALSAPIPHSAGAVSQLLLLAASVLLGLNAMPNEMRAMVFQRLGNR